MNRQSDIIKRKKNAEKSRRYYWKIKNENGEKYHRMRQNIRKQRPLYRKKLRLEAIKGYGGRCICCEENKIEFLSFDHVKGGGSKDRKKNKNNLTGPAFYRFLIKNKFPKKFRILCHNCNLSKGFYGYCPHEKTSQ